jgi:hypothetical protein
VVLEFPKRLVIGYFDGHRKWRTREIITCKVRRAVVKRALYCHECNRVIHPREIYFEEKLYYGEGYLMNIHVGKTQRVHIICSQCWKGGRMDPNSGRIKFVEAKWEGRPWTVFPVEL